MKVLLTLLLLLTVSTAFAQRAARPYFDKSRALLLTKQGGEKVQRRIGQGVVLSGILTVVAGQLAQNVYTRRALVGYGTSATFIGGFTIRMSRPR